MDKESIEKILVNVDWYDISIQRNPFGELFLILVCRTESQAANLYSLLTNSSFTVRGFAKDEKVKYVIRIYFDYSIILHCTTSKTITDYPPILWLENGEIPLITTGVFLGYNEMDLATYNYNAPVSFKNNINLN